MILTAVATATAVAAEPAGLAALGLNVKGLIFQVINFGLLLAILYRFAYRPLLKVLEDRRQAIAASLKSASDIARTKAELEQTGRAIVAGARREAEAIISRGEQAALEIQHHARAQGQAAADRLLKQAEAQITRQTQQIKAKLKQDVLQLVAIAAERVIAAKFDAAQDQILISQAVTAAEQAIKTPRR